jgi:hypothetical protein
LRIHPIHAPPSRVSLRRRGNRALMHANHPTATLAALSVLEQFAFARRGQNVNASIDPNDPPRDWEGFGRTIAFENRVPTTVLLTHERAAELRNSAAFPHANRSEPGYLYPRLVGVEFKSAISMRIR